MQTHNLGYPRIGSNRELKKACEQFWAGKLSAEALAATGKSIRQSNWLLQKAAGVDLIPSNDFSFYDQVLDMTLMTGAIPERYQALNPSGPQLYFAMARGYQDDGLDITAMEMTKWFDTNYHYLVPEFRKDQTFTLKAAKVTGEFAEARSMGITTKPVLIGPVSYLLLGKETQPGFDRLDLITALLPVYTAILSELQEQQAEWVQFDEPFLALDITGKAKEAYRYVYDRLCKEFPALKIMVATYFEGLGDNLQLAVSLPVAALHIDLVRCPGQLDPVLSELGEETALSLGVVDGRNVWKNDFSRSLELIGKAAAKIGTERLLLAPSCSLLHCPCDLEMETNEKTLPSEIKRWLAFAKQKVEEVATLARLAGPEENSAAAEKLKTNRLDLESRSTSARIYDATVRQRLDGVTEADARRKSPFPVRRAAQRQALHLPLFPTTTIGSFPQTAEVRSWRARWKKGEISEQQYEALLREETQKAIRWQEEAGMDVLVHGEFERNDMVEYFAEQLEGFAFTRNGWVQSYGSRCVKPPVIYGDVTRRAAMTVGWSAYAQSLTGRPVKGMLTGPVTLLQWSFVRDDEPRSETCMQIALAIRDEVVDLEKAGIRIIQIDEPAIREGLPLRKSGWQDYLRWAVRAFRVAAGGVRDETQIHTHMCYSQFNDIMDAIAGMDADVITIECSRSRMKLLDAFADFQYPNEIGPGVYDIHSPRVPSKNEMVRLLEKARAVIPADRLWVNPDCGLKTRRWEETKEALAVLVQAAAEMRR